MRSYVIDIAFLSDDLLSCPHYLISASPMHQTPSCLSVCIPDVPSGALMPGSINI